MNLCEVVKTITNNVLFHLGKTMAAQKTRSKSTVQMKLIDDKLKIIDDVPTSAVEMAVKEKVHFWDQWYLLSIYLKN